MGTPMKRGKARHKNGFEMMACVVHTSIASKRFQKRTLFSIFFALREDCWMVFLEILLQLAALGLLPASLTEFDDFPALFEGKPLQRTAIVAPPSLKLKVSKTLLRDTGNDNLRGSGCKLNGRKYLAE